MKHLNYTKVNGGILVFTLFQDSENACNTSNV